MDKFIAAHLAEPLEVSTSTMTGTRNFEGMCGVFGVLEYIKWVGETFGADHAEHFALAAVDYSV